MLGIACRHRAASALRWLPLLVGLVCALRDAALNSDVLDVDDGEGSGDGDMTYLDRQLLAGGEAADEGHAEQSAASTWQGALGRIEDLLSLSAVDVLSNRDTDLVVLRSLYNAAARELATLPPDSEPSNLEDVPELLALLAEIAMHPKADRPLVHDVARMCLASTTAFGEAGAEAVLCFDHAVVFDGLVDVSRRLIHGRFSAEEMDGLREELIHLAPRLVDPRRRIRVFAIVAEIVYCTNLDNGFATDRERKYCKQVRFGTPAVSAALLCHDAPSYNTDMEVADDDRVLIVRTIGDLATRAASLLDLATAARGLEMASVLLAASLPRRHPDLPYAVLVASLAALGSKACPACRAGVCDGGKHRAPALTAFRRALAVLADGNSVHHAVSRGVEEGRCTWQDMRLALAALSKNELHARGHKAMETTELADIVQSALEATAAASVGRGTGQA